MLGLFGTLNLGVRSLQTQRQGIEIAGQNLANVNNTAYARQRVQIQTSATVSTAIGPQGTGADAELADRRARRSGLVHRLPRETEHGGLRGIHAAGIPPRALGRETLVRARARILVRARGATRPRRLLRELP